MGKFLPVKKHPLFILVLLCCSKLINAQTLEEFNFSNPVTGTIVNNYVKGINNNEYICGYTVNSNGVSTGFILGPSGKGILLGPSSPTGVNTQVVSINDNNVAVMYETDASGTLVGAYKEYVSLNDTLGTVTNAQEDITSTFQETSAAPYGINNIDQISGWYQGATKWLFINQTDSITSGSAWNANRYHVGATNYNTIGGGINDSSIICGYYVDGSNEYPFIYRYNASAFQILGGSVNMRVYGINNQNTLVGSYKQSNGTYMGFYGTISGAGSVQIHSLNTVFKANTIQSVVNGINNKGEMVGEYYHPETSTWVGFIYRPNNGQYRLRNYSFSNDVWGGIVNSDDVLNGIWTLAYYGNFNYLVNDPYANNGLPLIDSTIKKRYHIDSLSRKNCTDWLSFATEKDAQGIGTSTSPAMMMKYKKLYKYQLFDKYYTKYLDSFGGLCYGFALTSLLHWYNPSVLNNWFGISATTPLSQITNTNNAAITGITRSYLKQMDKKQIQPQYGDQQKNAVFLWEGLYRTKTNFLDTSVNCNPRTFYISLKEGASTDYHELAPYKVRTPQQLPFTYNGTTDKDSVFVYDSNYPTDSTEYFSINGTSYFMPADSAHCTAYDNAQSHVSGLYFNEPGVKQMSQLQHAFLKATSSSVTPDPYVSLALKPRLDYIISAPGNGMISLTGSVYTNSIDTNVYSVQPHDIGYKYPFFYNMDTTYAVNIRTTNYVDSTMIWGQSIDNVTMGITRLALPNEIDYSSMTDKKITYGTHDNVAKMLNCHMVDLPADISDLSLGDNISITDLQVNQGDSLITANPSQYVYQVSKISGAATSYNITVDAIYGDTVKEFTATGIPISGHTSHYIDPYYNGTNGQQVVVYVDSGMTGTYSDTLFLPQVPLEIAAVRNADYIRLYPNPAAGNVTIAVNASVTGNYTVRVTDISGKIMLLQTLHHANAKDAIQLPTSHFGVGTYLIEVISPKGEAVYMDKLIKE